MKEWHWGLLGGLIAGVMVGSHLTAYGEDLRVTTYYPSPRGVYDELRANELVAKKVTLTDHVTDQQYTLLMNDRRLVIADLGQDKAFVIIEFPEEKRRRQ